MSADEVLRSLLQRQVEGIEGSDVFCQLYSPNMADFVKDPWPAFQLAIAILQDKPIIIACLPGRTPPPKLLAVADAVVYGEPAELAAGIKEATERLLGPEP